MTLRGATAYWISEGIFAASLTHPGERRTFEVFADPHELEIDDRYIYTLTMDGLVGFPVEGGPPQWFFRDPNRYYYSGLAGIGDALFFGSDSAEFPILWRLDRRTGEVLPTHMKLFATGGGRSSAFRNPASKLLADRTSLYARTQQGTLAIPLDDTQGTKLLSRANVELAQTRDHLAVQSSSDGQPDAGGDAPVEIIRKSDGARVAMLDDARTAFTTYGETVYYAIPSRKVIASLDLEHNARGEIPIDGHVEAIRVGDWGIVWVRALDGSHELLAAPRADR
ncbi:hypothetical protein LVJ94_25905 [Pendulispora rubella]|uniref:Uncharacterized protein n=1 Tax=Pendulispora rubella TaxID=2741070 RepID=A0ABZ2LM09_9BACT